MLVVVTYDVNTETSAGKRRLRLVAKSCMKYGQRVQNSVFECSVTSAEYLTLKHDLLSIIDVKTDSLRYYPEDDWLALSGLQHFSFCRRQWALIHIEQQWQENYLTTAGHLEHERAHDYEQSESRGDTLIMRDLRVFSRHLGITGACDVVEFHQSDDGVPLRGRNGLWSAYPIEYKHGQSKTVDADRLQLCAEAMCLEEMLSCEIRTFGAVMTTFVKGSLSCGQVRGPVQLGFARSIDPISVQEISITRIAVTTEADAAEKNNTMGNKFIIPYGLYRMNGYISAKLAQNVTGFCDEDLDVLWQAILNMFEFDRSAARGNMAVRKLYVFKHSSALGDAPSWKLFDSINVHKRAEVDAPRDFADYEVRVNREAIPESVSLTEMVDHAL